VITVAPGKHRMPRRRGVDRSALSAANQRPVLTDPDWPPSGAAFQPQRDGPPILLGPPALHPDHPSAPVPRVRAPLVSSSARTGRSPARNSNLGFTPSGPHSGLPRLPQELPIGPEATAAREAADKEAAHLRAVILSLSEQLSQMSAYIRENLASPGALATVPAPAIAPPRPEPRLGARSARPTSPARPRTAPTGKPQARPRQYQAMRIATAATATLFSFAALTGATEIALHGFKFFVFRSGGTGETAPTVGTDQQFLAHQAAAAKAAASHTPGRHSAKSTSR
jgi:hypothetical protein